MGAGLVFFSADVVLLPPLLLVPWGGEFASLMVKSGSDAKFFAAPRLPPCPVISCLWYTNGGGVSSLCRGFGVWARVCVFFLWLLFLSETSPFPHTRVCGLSRGRCFDVVVFMYFCWGRALLLSFLTTKLTVAILG